MTRCPWYLAGPLFGLIIVGLRATLNKPLTGLGCYIDLAEHVATPQRLGYRAFMLFGFVIGGALMGFGARTAGGCTGGHGMSGTSLGSLCGLESGRQGGPLRRPNRQGSGHGPRHQGGRGEENPALRGGG